MVISTTDHLHYNIFVNTDYDSDHPYDVYFEMQSTNSHINFASHAYLYNWLVKNNIHFDVVKHLSNEIRAVIKSKQDRTIIRLAFQIIKDRPLDDFVNVEFGPP